MKKNKCKFCNKDIFIRDSEVKLGRGKFCNIDCKRKYHENNKVVVNCKCGKEMILQKYLSKRIKYCSEECRKKYVKQNISGFFLKKSRSKRQSEKNGMWKGDNVGYSALHSWIYRTLGKPKKCIQCGSIKNIEWANIDHKYHRNTDDFIQLCTSCHRKYDDNWQKQRDDKGRFSSKIEGAVS